MSRVPTVLSLQQLAEEASPPATQPTQVISSYTAELIRLQTVGLRQVPVS